MSEMMYVNQADMPDEYLFEVRDAPEISRMGIVTAVFYTIDSVQPPVYSLYICISIYVQTYQISTVFIHNTPLLVTLLILSCQLPR